MASIQSDASTSAMSIHVTEKPKHDGITAAHMQASSHVEDSAAAVTDKISSNLQIVTAAHNANEPDSMYGMVDVTPFRRSLIVFGLCSGLLLSLMDTSIMATAIYTIALDFNSLTKAFWAILSYQLAYLGFAVVFARLSDFIGRRVAVITAFVLFVGFSLGCGWAQNINQLILFRTVQGIGGAGLYSLTIILLVEASTPKLSPYISSLIGATIAISGVLGPILGGVLTEYASWRWIFWINGPTGAVAVACFVLGWPNQASKTAYATSRRKFTDFDWPGAVLILGASVLVVFGLQEAGSGLYTWSSPVVLGTLISGCLCWVLLFIWEYYIYAYHGEKFASMFPFTIVLNRPLMSGVISTMLTGFSAFLTVISLPLRFQIVNLRTPASAGVHLLPFLCATGLGGALGGMVSNKKNLVCQTFLLSGCFILLGVGLLSTLGDGVSIEPKCYGFQILIGIGVGATYSAISVMTAISSDRRSHSAAQGIAAQVRIFGGSIGLAASNAIFNATCAHRLRGVLTSQQIADLQTNTRILTTLDAAGRQAVRLAYAQSFRTSLRVSCIIAGVSLVVAVGTWQKNPPMMPRQRMEMMKKAREEKETERDQEKS